MIWFSEWENGRCSVWWPVWGLQPAAVTKPQLHTAPEQEPGEFAFDTGDAGTPAAAWCVRDGTNGGLQRIAAEDGFADAPGHGDVPGNWGKWNQEERGRRDVAVAEFDFHGDWKYDYDAKKEWEEKDW